MMGLTKGTLTNVGAEILEPVITGVTQSKGLLKGLKSLADKILEKHKNIT